MRHSPDCWIISSVGSRPCWTLLPSWFSHQESTRPSVHRSAIYIVCKCRSGSSSSWQCSHIKWCLDSTALPYSRRWTPQSGGHGLAMVSDVGVYVDTGFTANAPLHHWQCEFPVTALRIQNSLPSSVTLSTSLSAFRWRLKSELFLQCFGLDCVWWFCSAMLVSLYHAVRTRPFYCSLHRLLFPVSLPSSISVHRFLVLIPWPKYWSLHRCTVVSSRSFGCTSCSTDALVWCDVQLTLSNCRCAVIS